MRRNFTFLIVAISGCGPLSKPMVTRLDSESQKIVDDSWSNMLNPPNRLDRHVLLDTMVVNQLHQTGVDRLELTSVKEVRGGRVTLRVHFDKRYPSQDEFTITYVDRSGRVLRQERYTSAEVDESFNNLSGFSDVLVSKPNEELTEAEIKQLQQQRQRQREERLDKVRAATQPAS